MVSAAACSYVQDGRVSSIDSDLDAEDSSLIVTTAVAPRHRAVFGLRGCLDRRQCPMERSTRVPARRVRYSQGLRTTTRRRQMSVNRTRSAAAIAHR
jgi:hypothetical protein